MEYVAGVRITRYCDSHRLSIEDRLEVFNQVCILSRQIFWWRSWTERPFPS
jgi:hypothetical protein